MPRYNNRSIAGQPTLPYTDNQVNEKADCWLEFTFVDRNGNLQVPSTLSYRIDNLTNNAVILASTAVTVGLASQMEVNIPGSLNTLTSTCYGTGSQVNQVSFTATFADGSTDTGVAIYEVIAIAVVGGS